MFIGLFFLVSFINFECNGGTQFHQHLCLHANHYFFFESNSPFGTQNPTLKKYYKYTLTDYIPLEIMATMKIYHTI